MRSTRSLRMSRCCKRAAQPLCAHYRAIFLWSSPPPSPRLFANRTFPPWRNPWLLAAIALSMGQHLMILYVPMFHGVFGVAALDASEWALVMYVSVPVIFLDEILKLITRMRDPSRKTIVSSSPFGCNHGV